MKKVTILTVLLGVFCLGGCTDAVTRFWNGQPVFTERYHARSDCEQAIEKQYCADNHRACWNGDHQTLTETATKQFKRCMREKGYLFSRKP